jgi:hypothetical protein
MVVAQRPAIVRKLGFFSSYAATNAANSWRDFVPASEQGVCAVTGDCCDVVEDMMLRNPRLRLRLTPALVRLGK